MQQTLRPYVTAGIAIVGSGLIAATPAAPPMAGPVTRDIVLTDWVEQFNIAADNATQLLNNFLLAPGVGFQQMLVNQDEFWNSIINDPSTIPAVMQQMQEQLDAVLTGFTLINASGEASLNGFTGTLGEVIVHTISGTDVESQPPTFGHDLLFALLPQFLPSDQAEFLTPIVNFLASPLSGIIIGSLGPAIAPWVALSNSISDGDFLNALPNMVGAYFNGATLNLDWLIPLIEESGLLPMPEGAITSLEFAFGGLLSGGTVAAGPWQLADENGDIIASVPAVGGSIFNSLGLGLDAEAAVGLPLQINIAGQGIGPIGAWLAWDQTVGALLGSGWDGKGPTVVTPPLFGFDPIGDDVFDDGGAGAGAATDLQDILAAFLVG